MFAKEITWAKKLEESWAEEGMEEIQVNFLKDEKKKW
jgi:hypothetical protein